MRLLILDDGPVVHIGVQVIGAGGDLLVPVGTGGEEAEEPLLLDEAVLRKHVGHIPHVRAGDLGGIALPVRHLGIGEDVLRQGDDGGVLLLVEGQHVPRPDPAQAGQGGRTRL